MEKGCFIDCHCQLTAEEFRLVGLKTAVSLCTVHPDPVLGPEALGLLLLNLQPPGYTNCYCNNSCFQASDLGYVYTAK